MGRERLTSSSQWGSTCHVYSPTASPDVATVREAVSNRRRLSMESPFVKHILPICIPCKSYTNVQRANTLTAFLLLDHCLICTNVLLSCCL
jgi:hypothetical protein